MKKRITISDCVLAATNKGGECLSNEYVSAKTKLLWRCKGGHEWSALYAKVKKETWCPFCAGNIKKGIDYCHKAANERCGKCLSEIYKNNKAKLKWQCKYGHIWLSSPVSVVLQNTWCPYCSGKAKHTIDDCKKLAYLKNGKCLSTEYINAKSKLVWECENKHSWEATFDDINHNYWCPHCVIKKTHRVLVDIIKNIFPNYVVHSNYSGYDWLKTMAGGKQHIDIFVEGIKLAIEYDGIQHFKPIDFFGGVNGLKYRKKLDRKKYAKIKYHYKDIKYFIRFNYKEIITRDYIINEFIKEGILDG